MTRKRVFLIGVITVVVAGATVALATRSGNGDANKKDEFATTKVEKADVQVEVLEVGTVEPGIKVDVKSALSGKLVELPVREGDVVRKGQVIAAVEPDVNQAQTLATVRRSVNQAEIEFAAAKNDYKAKEELLRAGLLSIEAHRDSETRYRTAAESLEAAREKSQIVQSSGVPLSANANQVANITAPMDGVVIRRPVELGEAVTGAGSFNAGTVIVTIADLSTMLVKAGVNEVDIGKVRLGETVTVTLDAYPKVRFAGKVARIAPAARLQDQVKVFDVEIALDSQGKELRTGMTANISVKGDRAEGVLAVPVEAVFRRDEGDVVYVLKAASTESDGKKPAPKATPDPRDAWKQHFEERKVETGLASLSKVEVRSGLVVGEKVALEDPTKTKKKES